VVLARLVGYARFIVIKSKKRFQLGSPGRRRCVITSGVTAIVILVVSRDHLRHMLAS
jgi:hypothetical protein